MNEEQWVFSNLSVALAVGLLIGVERGWEKRDAQEGERVAGVRTYGLIGLLGGCAALLGEKYGSLMLGLGFVGLAGMFSTVYVVNLNSKVRDVGITSMVTGLLTFVFGALAATGETAVAAAAAVLTTLLLSYKPVLHRWVNALESGELRAGIKLLLISVVLLPVLPNQGYGPWQALNPYAIWWMVVLIAAISFVGYFAIKIAGTRRGTLFTGLFGGLASSTAVTLHFSRLSRHEPALVAMFSTAILLACGTMLPRMVLVASLLNPDLFPIVLVPTVVMAFMTYLPALWYWRSQSSNSTEQFSPVTNPLEMKTALSFGFLLAVVMLLGKALRHWFGDTGILALAAASGVTDVDAITLSLARMSQDDLTLHFAATGIVIAAAVNSVVKGGMATFMGGVRVGIRVGLPLMVSAIGGMLAVWFWVW